MTLGAIMPVIAMLLLLLVALVGAFRGLPGPRTDRPKSRLARDGGHGGVGYLIPAPDRAAAAELRRKAGVK